MAIDVGGEAIDRDSYLQYGGSALIGFDNPANADGSIDTFEVWAYSTIAGFKAGTLFLVASTTYECRDAEIIGTVASGSKQTFSGLNCTVATGDYIGCYFASGAIERSSSGFANCRYCWGEDGISPGTQKNYSYLLAEDCMSLKGTGTEAGGGAKNLYTGGFCSNSRLNRRAGW